MLEIVERLCSHIAIIHRGALVAHGSLDALRAGVRAQPGAGLNPQPGQRVGEHGEALAGPVTLEQIFLSVVGDEAAPPHHEGELAWLS